MSSKWEKLPVLTENNANEGSRNTKESELNQVKEKDKADAIAKGEEKVNELQEEIRINGLIDKEFENFQHHLLKDTKAIDNLRRQRNLSIEKMKD